MNVSTKPQFERVWCGNIQKLLLSIASCLQIILTQNISGNDICHYFHFVWPRSFHLKRRIRISAEIEMGSILYSLITQIYCRLELENSSQFPQTKLQKGNVFSRVCPSFGLEVEGVSYGHYSLDLTLVQGPPDSHIWTHSQDWRRVQACGNLFTGGPLLVVTSVGCWSTHAFLLM